jgi:hypothetical protein
MMSAEHDHLVICSQSLLISKRLDLQIFRSSRSMKVEALEYSLTPIVASILLLG